MERQVVLLILKALLSGSAFASEWFGAATTLPGNFYQLAGPQDVVPIPVDILSGEPGNVILQFGEPQVDMSVVVLEGAEYQRVELLSEGSTLHEGFPDLPRVSRLVMVSPHGGVELDYLVTGTRSEYLTRPVLPKQPLEGNALDGENISTCYSVNAFWPENIVEVSEPMLFRDVRFVILAVHPVQYNPVTGEMRVHDNIEVSLRDTGGSGVNEREIEPVSITPGFRKLYSNFINFEHSTLDELPLVPGTQLILCQNNATVINKMNELATWRKKKGIDATVVSTAISGTTVTQIRNYINTQYVNGGGQLEFVTVVGDANGSGAYYFPTDELAGYPYGELDNYYGMLGSGPNPDPLPDIGVGRIPAADFTQLSSMVSKSINYEADPFMTDTTWFTRTWCAVHTGFIPSNTATKEYTRQIMLQRGMNPGDMTVFTGNVTPSVLEQRVNPGLSVFNHRLSWGNSEMNPPDLDGLTNGRMLPFVAVITCGMGWYNNGESVTEAWVRRGTPNTPVGAIGAMGMAGNSTRVAENNIVDGGAMMGLFARDIREQSLIMLNGKLELYRNFWDAVSQTSVEEFSAWCNLMGDAAVPIMIEVPQTVTLSQPGTVHRYTNNVAVQITRAGQPVENALVGMYKSPNVFARGYTDETGSVNLAASLADTGWVYVTVTGTGLKTKLDSLHVINASTTLALSSVTVDDDNLGGTQGNGDGILNPGEMVDLNVVLINRGTSQAATGIIASLSTSEPTIQIQSGSSSYPNIAVGATGAPSIPFRILCGALQNAEPVALYLAVTSSAGTQNVRVDLTPSSANVQVNSTDFLGGDSQLDPGDSGALSATIQNNGSRALLNASGILRSLDSHVTVTDSVGVFGAVAIGATAENLADAFAVQANINTVGGYGALMELVVVDTDGFRDSLEFVQIVGVSTPTTPTGPDAYGYYAYDNTELQPAGTATQYDWTEISAIGTNLGFVDEFEDDDDSDVIALPFEFTFYGSSFDSVTICSNGWLAFGSHGAMFDFRNWRIGSPMGPPNMVAAYWDDLATTGGGVYYYYDPVDQRFIVQWNVQTLWSDVPEVFQVVLYNPATYPTPTGDGKILVQYQEVTPNSNEGVNDMPWATVGIQNENHLTGVEYYYSNVYAPGAANLTDGLAVMYTTAGSGTLFSTLTVLSPDGGEALFIDSTATIAWFPGSTGGTVRIELSRNGLTGSWETITGSAPNTGFFGWQVNGASSTDCFIRVISNIDPDEADTSDAPFSIGALTYVLNESFEGGANGWTLDSAGGQWVSDWHVSIERSQTGTHSYKCGSTGTDTHRSYNDARLVSPVISNLPASAWLRFAQQYETELSGAFPDSAYDGCVLEVSVDGGAWQALTPMGGYNKTFRYQAGGGNPATGPMQGRACFGGTQSTWSTVSADLSGFAGSALQLRFRFGSDAVNNREGWYVDDVQVYSPSVNPPPPVGLTIAVSGTDIVLRWEESGFDTYLVYSAADAEGPFDTFEGSTGSTSLTIANGTAASKRFYYVVGE